MGIHSMILSLRVPRSRIRPRPPRAWVRVAAITVGVLAFNAGRPAEARVAAQGVTPDTDRKWELEIHGGGIFPRVSGGGTSAFPSPGMAFTTQAGTASRYVSSWYVGDGAALLNEFSEAVGLTSPIIPLGTPVLGGSSTRKNVGSFGFRLGRVIGSRLTVELTFDYSPGDQAFSTAAQEGIEASRVTFITAMTPVMPPPTLVTGVSVTSVSSFEASGGQYFGTGVVNLDLRSEGRLIPYVSGGAGAVSQTGAVATLEGNYRFEVPNIPVDGNINETDRVRVGFDRPGFVGVVGGGMKYYLTSRWGLRGDVRVYLTGAPDTRLDLAPRVLTVGMNGISLATNTTPGLQFSNLTPSGTLPRSNLSDRTSDFRSFSGSGTETQLNVSMGFFWRF